MKKCEYCNGEHEGLYGSGRFCSQKCARGFSTRRSRKDINEKVSRALKGKFFPYKKEKRAQSKTHSETMKKYYEEKFKSTPFEELSCTQQKKRLLEENNECYICHQGKIWNGKELKLELHHIDGNRKNKVKENCEMVCPNCHSQTPNFRFYNRKQTQESKHKLSIASKRYFSNKNANNMHP